MSRIAARDLASDVDRVSHIDRPEDFISDGKNRISHIDRPEDFISDGKKNDQW
jgi:hypothetical protein